eukprot:jgi/Bigna1/140607/aug1.57_g15315
MLVAVLLALLQGPLHSKAFEQKSLDPGDFQGGISTDRKVSLLEILDNLGSNETHPLKDMDGNVRYHVLQRLRRNAKSAASSAQMRFRKEDPRILKLVEDQINENGTGKYSLQEMKSRGGFGEIYLSRDLSNDNLVAVKIIPHANSKNPKDIFLNEVKIFKLIEEKDIPNRVGFIDHFILEGGQAGAIVMQYINGGDLMANTKDGNKMTAKYQLKYRRCMRDVLAFLEKLHQSNLIHADIKPENIMLQKKSDGNVQCVVVDYGLVTEVVPQSSTKKKIHIVPITHTMNIDSVKNSKEFTQCWSYLPHESKPAYPIHSLDMFAFGVTMVPVFYSFYDEVFNFMEQKPKKLGKTPKDVRSTILGLHRGIILAL